MEYAEGLLELVFYFLKIVFPKQFLPVKGVNSYNLDVVYKSDNYIIVNKCYDLVINSNDPNEKVHLLFEY